MGIKKILHNEDRGTRLGILIDRNNISHTVRVNNPERLYRTVEHLDKDTIPNISSMLMVYCFNKI